VRRMQRERGSHLTGNTSERLGERRGVRGMEYANTCNEPDNAVRVPAPLGHDGL
jgi:hypothetical protein